MNILHIGWGFYPWRKGGLILYARDLMNEQVKQGHCVSYFCAGRKIPVFKKKSFLHRWSWNGIHTYEIINSPISNKGDSGTLEPLKTLNESYSEQTLIKVFNQVKPDIVHIHEMAGLPSSIIKIIRKEYHIPIIMSLADYYLLCPTLKLYDYKRNKNCDIRNEMIGQACLNCILKAPHSGLNELIYSFGSLLSPFENKFNLEQSDSWSRLRAFGIKLYFLYKNIVRRLFGGIDKNKQINQLSRKECISLVKEFKKRRDMNVSHLKSINHLVARSSQVKEIYQTYLGKDTSVSVLNPYLKHIDDIIPVKINPIFNCVKFVTLNGFSSVPKGGELLVDAIKYLNKEGLGDYFEVHSFGYIHQDFVRSLRNIDNVFDHGTYNVDELNSLLNGMHVGIIPSIWEEVFGYIGVEMLSKGLPIIANKKGGIPDYLEDGKNGLMNVDSSLNGLVYCMRQYIEDTTKIMVQNDFILKHWHKNYFKHYLDVMKIYEQFITK